MKHVKSFKLFEEDAYHSAMTSGDKKTLSTIKRLEKNVPELSIVYAMYVKINKEAVDDEDVDGLDPVDFEDVEFYAEQINILYFDNTEGVNNLPFSEKLAEKLFELDKHIKEYIKLGTKFNASTIKDPEIKKAVLKIIKKSDVIEGVSATEKALSKNKK